MSDPNQEEVTRELVEEELLKGALISARRLTDVVSNASNTKDVIAAGNSIMEKAGFTKEKAEPIGKTQNINFNLLIEGLKTAGKALGYETITGNERIVTEEPQKVLVQPQEEGEQAVHVEGNDEE